MGISKRSVALAAFGTIPLLAMKGMIAPVLVILLYNLTLALIITADYLTIPKENGKPLRMKRRFEERLSLGAENRVEIEVTNNTQRSLRIDIKEHPPLEVSREPRLFSMSLGPRESRTFSYMLLPKRRGSYAFGEISYRIYGALELAIRYGKAENHDRFKVYPNLRNLSKYDMLARKNRLSELGIKTNRMYGEGSEYKSLRDYLPDDDYRRINWKASARRGTLISNEYESDRSQSLILALDTGRLMGRRCDGVAKVDYSIDAALMLGYVANMKADRIGLITFSSEVHQSIAPGRGLSHIHNITDNLYETEVQTVETDYRRVFEEVNRITNKRSLVCIFTDIIDIESSAELIEYLGELRRKHLILCSLIRDGSIDERYRSMPKDAADMYMKKVASDLLHDRREVIRRLIRKGVEVIDTDPKNLRIVVVNRYMELKGRIAI
jgi:uncharacterized protein (DUF58 family)